MDRKSDSGVDDPAVRIAELVAAIGPPSGEAAASSRAEMEAKTKPPGSLGRLEDLAVAYAAIRGEAMPGPPRFGIVVAAADHGVSARGVSAFPAEVTGQMVANIATGGAAISVLAREVGARMVVVDAGSRAAEVPAGAIDARVARGSGDITVEAAMTEAEARRLIGVGADLAAELIADGCTAIGLGKMGIGNSTVAAALTAAVANAAPEAVVGRGTGVDDEGLRRKVEAVTAALGRLGPGALEDPVALLAEIGGLEIAVLVGVTLGAAAARTPVLTDGFISTSAVLVAALLAPDAASAVLATHRSVEPGHTLALEWLESEPILDLGLRLGEGSGAALAMPILAAAVRILREMATFEGAGVSERG